jgi:hypothetical protein
MHPREYRIICLLRRADGHLRALGYSENGNGVVYDGTWTVDEARRAIEQGHRLYTMSSVTGVQADLEVLDGRLLTRPSLSSDTKLDALPDCSRR